MAAAPDLRARFGALTSDDVRRLDEAALECGIDVTALMEVAGWQVARSAWHALRRRPAGVLVLAGRGNNGGDGLVAARHLATWGCEVVVIVVAAAAGAGDLIARLARAATGAGATVAYDDAGASVADAVASAAVCIDALLGTGLASPPRTAATRAIHALNAATSVLSVDLPSGLSATTGDAYSPCVRARITCTLTAMKAGLWEPAGRRQAGTIVAADIGMPRAAWERCGLVPPRALRGGALLRVPDR